MLDTEARSCRCGYKVSYQVTQEGRQAPVTQFVATLLRSAGGVPAGSSAVVSHCPGCGEELSFASTQRRASWAS